MKNLIIKIAAVVVLIISYNSAIAQITKAEIQATGLTCSMCSNAINKQLKAINEIDSVATDLNTNTFTVYVAPQNTLTPKKLKDAVEKAGFFIGSLVVTVPENFLTANEKTYIPVGEIKLNSNKTVAVKILDKGYITQKQYKKSLKTLATIATYNSDNEDDFHFKVLN